MYHNAIHKLKFVPDTYTQLHIHFVFAVKYRAAIIQLVWEERLHKYITGIVQNNGHKLLCINSVFDHLHLFIGLNPKQSISELMQVVKGDSSGFINHQKLTLRKFHRQQGYGAFSNSHSQIDGVGKYILNQKNHHRKRTFRDDYLSMLNDYGVAYGSKYVFHDLMDE